MSEDMERGLENQRRLICGNVIMMVMISIQWRYWHKTIVFLPRVVQAGRLHCGRGMMSTWHLRHQIYAVGASTSLTDSGVESLDS
jgi:hypothetical protein